MSRVALGDVATERKENYKGDKSGLPIVRLEHLTLDEITLSMWNDNVDNTYTKVFHISNVLFGRKGACYKKTYLALTDGLMKFQFMGQLTYVYNNCHTTYSRGCV